MLTFTLGSSSRQNGPSSGKLCLLSFLWKEFHSALSIRVILARVVTLHIYLEPILDFGEEPSVNWDLVSFFPSANSSNGTSRETLAVDCGTGGSKLYASSENILFPWFSCVLSIRQCLIPCMPFPFDDTVAWAGPPLWTGGSENI